MDEGRLPNTLVYYFKQNNCGKYEDWRKKQTDVVQKETAPLGFIRPALFRYLGLLFGLVLFLRGTIGIRWPIDVLLHHEWLAINARFAFLPKAKRLQLISPNESWRETYVFVIL